MSHYDDSVFMKNFMLILAALFISAAFLAGLANLISHSVADSGSVEQQAIEARIKPIGQVTLKTDAAQQPLQAAAPAAPAAPKSGEEVYKAACFACHDTGAAGAPKVGDAALWKDRIAKGNATLYDHAINGFQTMPPKGGQAQLSDEEIKATVDYMIAKSQ